MLKPSKNTRFYKNIGHTINGYSKREPFLHIE